METEQINELITLLHEVDRNPNPFQTNNHQYNHSHPIIEKIVILATEYLTIGPDVHDYRAILRSAGYPVYPGETDSFGWLTAYFQMKHGIILFG